MMRTDITMLEQHGMVLAKEVDEASLVCLSTIR